jgi:galactokinase
MTMTLKQHVLSGFEQAFGGAPDLVARAPGRVNLIGEHTDYNDGFVFPAAIEAGTMVALRRRTGRDIRAVALDLGDARDAFAIDAVDEGQPTGDWRDYIRGMAAMLHEAGVPIEGAELAIAGDLPRGAGLSSSASLEVAVGLALTEAVGANLPRTVLARLAQAAENRFAGCNCGIMDQLASAAAEDGSALLIDCRDFTITPVSIPDDLVILIAHTGVERQLVEGEYNARRRQCEEAAAALGVEMLRDADLDMLERAAGSMPETTYRRARHVISEEPRTMAMANALAAGDLPRIATLMAAGHASLRDDFEVTVPKLDELVALLAEAIGDKGGARMTGGGFGGAAVALVHRDEAARVRAEVERRYRDPAGRPPLIIETRAAAGASIL